jgi:uncharacterized membrane protein YukC
MLFQKTEVNIDGRNYEMVVSPVNKGKTKVVFQRGDKGIVVCVEDDEVELNTGLNPSEVKSCMDWMNNNLLDVWNKAQNTEKPTEKELDEIAKRADEIIKRADPEARRQFMNALDKELERRAKGN